MSEENKALVRELLETAYNAKDLAIVDKVIAQNYVGNFNGHERRGPEGVKAHFSGDHTGWPDSHVAVEEQVADGDKVVTRWTWSGTHTGRFGPWLATNQFSVCPGVVISRIAGGKIVEEWWCWDSLGWLKQLGFADYVRPAQGQSPPGDEDRPAT